MYFFFDFLILSPFFIICILINIEITKLNIKFIKLFILILFLFFFFYCCCLGSIFTDNSYFTLFSLPFFFFFNINFINTHIYTQKIFTIDGISFIFIFLSIFILLLCYLSLLETVFFKIKYYSIIIYLILIFLNLVFLANDVFLFYVFFELLLIPMYFIINIWGTRARKIKASYYFFFYTFVGSLFLLLGLILLLNIYGATNIFYLLILENNILNLSINFSLKLFIWICLFLPFFIKIPMFPTHIWLLEAHVEAPTIGSVILAALYLKLGGYGIFRFLLPLFISQFYLCLPYIQCIALMGFIYTSLAALRQLDIKKIIAYSSVAHMNLAIIGLFSISFEGILGSIYLMLSHGLTSAAMFFSAGILYFRYQTRISSYFGGLVQIMPLFSFFTFINFLANFGLPGFSSFIGELLIFLGIININLIVFFFSMLGIFLCLIFTLVLFTKLFFGPVNYLYISGFLDLSKNEFYIFFFLSILNLFFGLSTDFIFQLIETNILFILEKYYYF
jgi:proton-translocating NADH-quinone oxidoreductase chain M